MLEEPSSSKWLNELGVRDVASARDNLRRMLDSPLSIEQLGVICGQLAEYLPALSDPDMALNNLQRFVAASSNPSALASLIERDERALQVLLTIFSSSQFLSDVLARQPDQFDLLRLTEGQPMARTVLIDDICLETEPVADQRSLMTLLRQIKRRELLRIAYGDLVRDQSIEVVTRQISYLADALCEAALRFASGKLAERHGLPLRPDGTRCRFSILALGKLGGEELNYSSDIDLMFLYERDGRTDGERPIENREFFDRLGRQFVNLLTEPTELGIAYRVDLRLRPEGRHGPIASSLAAAASYYDTRGRTWERQAMIKARPVAGDVDLGEEFLQQMQPWIWRRYLSRADITGIKALKRRIEARVASGNSEARNVKTGHGGIRDIEFAIQFLQLLGGGDLPDIRTTNTLEAIMALERDGCLTYQERSFLEENYALLRKIEHRLQIMFDLQTHTLPEDEDQQQKLAVRMGFREVGSFRESLAQKTAENRKILNHLLHDAFGDEGEIEPEVDLVLDPNPSPEAITEILGKYRFADIEAAYRNLMALGEERVRFLSTRRCRHFLASIAPRLLESINATGDPDATLVNLVNVSDSLGGKGVLWELFSANRATLELYVRLCGASNYLAGILTSNPGMIDELLDSLLLDRLPSREALEATLADLARGADDLLPIVRSFKNSQHLRVGVRDILGKDGIEQTHAALSDIAEVILQQVAHSEYAKLEEKFGRPMLESASPEHRPCELIILAMGKMGGREPNYHSDMDLVFLYEADGSTQPIRPSQKSRATTNQHFFSELGQRIISAMNQAGPQGRLYDVDPRLRPTGRSGTLAISLADFAKYFAQGHGRLWERQALCKARPIFGSPEVRDQVAETVRQAITNPPWHSRDATDIRRMRSQLEQSAAATNLKRGPGGTVDIEFVVQMLQLKHAAGDPSVMQPGTLAALESLRAGGNLSEDHCDFFDRAYRFLRSVESHLRLMNTTARHDLPQETAESNKLAWLLDFSGGQSLIDETKQITGETRQRFQEVFEIAEAGTS